ncbi:hypothetical protein D3C81_2196490 [compost metagenome]
MHNYKDIQLKQREERLLKNVEEKAICFIGESSEYVYSQKLYAFLKYRYNYIKNIAPDLVEKIEELRSEHNADVLNHRRDLIWSMEG